MPPADRRRVLLLSPSAGLGGGIERYVQTLQWAFAARAVDCARIDLDMPGAAGHWRLLRQLDGRWRAAPGSVRIVAGHRALLPAALILARRPAVSGISVLCHGSDVWGSRARPRWWLEHRAMRSARVRVVAVSSFTAGAVGVGCGAAVLPPGLSRSWFDELAKAAVPARRPGGNIRLVTAFRLADWRDKGLPELLDAVRLLGRPDVMLTICGSGALPPEAAALVSAAPWCRVRSGLTDAELAAELADADLFVLATRTRPGRRPCGEGFGLVLLEAQVAGTAVVAPASGGSHDAYLDAVTGIAPAAESSAALASALREMLSDAGRLARMGERAAAWAQESHDPDRYAAQVIGRLL
jgi:glycosyltransferase involved in cell wall biosynthesis